MRWTHSDEAALRALPDLLAVDALPGHVAEDLRDAVTCVRVWDGEATPWLTLRQALADARMDLWAACPVGETAHPLWDLLAEFDYSVRPLTVAIGEQIAEIRGER